MMSWRWLAPIPMAKVQQNIKITLHFSEKVYDWLYFHGSFVNMEVIEGNYSSPIYRTDSYQCYICVLCLITQRKGRLILVKSFSYSTFANGEVKEFKEVREVKAICFTTKFTTQKAIGYNF